jgi:hypothetical protein
MKSSFLFHRNFSVLNLRKSLLLVFLLVAVSVSAFTPTHFRISVIRMNPMAYPSRDVSYGYMLSVKNDSVNLYLPYMGRAYQLPYGGGDGLNFKEPIKSFKYKIGKKGGYKISFETRHEQEIYKFNIVIYPETGSASIDVIPNQRQQISYDARLEDKEK